VGLAAFLQRLIRGAPEAPIATRLSEAEAIEIAKRDAANHALRDKLNIATATRAANGTVIWTVETQGIGSFIYVVIDDATGTVLERRVHEGR
jgi:hypothetical protein